MKTFSRRIEYFLLALVVILLFVAVTSHFPNSVLSWDIFGYYLYLPLLFIYNDLGLRDLTIVNQIIDTYQNTSTLYQAMPGVDGGWVLKYPMGMALLYSPWFFVGHIWAGLSAFPADGFSYPYQASLIYGSFVYTVIGLIVLWKSLRQLFKPATVLAILILIVFGTNYLVHTVFHGQGLMSHNYLFTVFAFILYFTIKWHDQPSMKYAIALGTFIGIAALSRPTELLVVIVPILWNVKNKSDFFAKLQLFLKNWKNVLVAGLIIVFFGSLQLIYFKIYTGKFLFNSYGNNAGEGMEFLSPYIVQVLISFRKGWLIYTPIMIFALLGFITLYKNRRAYFLSIFVFFLFSFYVIASWSCWWYADCFSQRALIPMYVFLSLPLGALLEYVFSNKRRIYRVLLVFILVALLALNLFQSWQFLNGIIHTSRMTKPYYRSVFLKSNIPPGATDKLLVDRLKTPEELLNSGKVYSSVVLGHFTFESEGITPDTNSVSWSNGKVFELNEQHQFSPKFEIAYKDLNVNEYGIIKISAKVFPTTSADANPLIFTATFMHNGYAYSYFGKQLDEQMLQLNTWNEVEFYYLTPEVRKLSDPFRTTFWLKGEYSVYIDDFKVELFMEEE
ncbi:MAG: glycosyltransferase family 39 protein [Bacteroidales bacterium]|jgi:hypothetical protein|nr:glycosyltransferase family 39 protein [Bacteroidales bacterium]